MADLHEHLARQWHPDNPYGASEHWPSSKEPVAWLCPRCGRTWVATSHSRVHTGAGCRPCSARDAALTRAPSSRPKKPPRWQAAPGQSLAELHPDLTQEYDRANPRPATGIRADSNSRVWWVCRRCGGRWQVAVRARTGPGRVGECPDCADDPARLQAREDARRAAARARRLARRCLAVDRPEIAAGWHPDRNPTTAREHLVSDKTIAWWRCPRCGREWQAAIKNRCGAESAACASCASIAAGRAAATPGPGESLADQPQLAHLVADWHPDNPTRPAEHYPFANTRVRWRCRHCGHEWSTTVASRARGTGCRRWAAARISAARRRPAPGQSLGDLHENLVAEWPADYPLTAFEVKPQAGNRVRWTCTCGHQWVATVQARSTGASPCLQCREVNASDAELRLRHEIAAVTGQEVRPGAVSAGGRTWQLDMVMAEPGVLIEFDGEYWHRTTAAKDDRKRAALVAAGWTVLRVREEPLPCPHPLDVPVATQTGPAATYRAAVATLTALAAAGLVVPSLAGYRAGGVLWGSAAAQSEREQRSRAVATRGGATRRARVRTVLTAPGHRDRDWSAPQIAHQLGEAGRVEQVRASLYLLVADGEAVRTGRGRYRAEEQ